jgi:hypothetical protein
MFYDLRDECFIFLFGILAVEDAVGFIAEADASEAEFTSSTCFTIYKITYIRPNIN